MTRILVSNDDGYFAPGLAALVAALRPLGEVTVVAPEQNRSGASNSLTLDGALIVREATNGFLYVNGTPADCVHLALTGLLDHRPDIVVSGINDGANLGDDTLYSGTVAAAMEGHLMGLPALAFSLTQRGLAHLDSAARVAHDLVKRALDKGLGPSNLLNVNIPNRAFDDLQGIVATRLGKRHGAQPALKEVNPRGQTVYWVGAAGAPFDAQEGTDFYAVAQGQVSVTPLHIDLTHHAAQGATWAWLQ